MVNEMNKPINLAVYTTEELSLRVMNTEDLYILAENTKGWTDENAIQVLKDAVDNRYVYTDEQITDLINDIKGDWGAGETTLDLEDFNDPLRGYAPHIDTSFGPVDKDYDMEPKDDVSLVEQIYGSEEDVE